MSNPTATVKPLEEGSALAPVVPLSRPAAARWRLSSRLALGGFITGCMAIALMVFTPRRVDSEVIPVGYCLLFAGWLVGFVAAIVAAVKIRYGVERAARGEAVAVTVVASIVGLIFTAVGALFAIAATVGFARGRQLRRFGRVLLPKVGPGEAFSELALTAEVPIHLRASLAERWRENGRTEHASVAAFARLTLDLMALGAPPQLLHDAQRDADDEIRHAELCFSLARALDGGASGPRPFPQAQRARTLSRWRTLALAQLAVDSLIDGALHEGVSARVIARLAQRCEVPQIRSVLKELAADEGRHCAHGWDVVEWCLAEGGWPVRWALRGALRTIPATLKTPRPDEAARGAWELFGIHGHALEAKAYADGHAELVRRVGRLCAAPVLRTA